MQGFMNVDKCTYMPISSFTLVDLGCERGNRVSNFVNKFEEQDNVVAYLQLFEEIWRDSKKLQDVTDVVIESISAAYKENSPQFIYL